MVLYLVLNAKKDTFTDIIPDLASSQQRFNPAASLVNVINPQLPLSKESNALIKQATLSVNLQGGQEGAYEQKEPIIQNQVPESVPTAIYIAQNVCETVQGSSFDASICSSFDTPDFSSNCGITFDVKSTNSKGLKQGIGGLFLAPDRRKAQADAASNKQASEYIYTPTFGKTGPGTFAADKATCIRLSEETACKKSKSFESPNCAQCVSSSEFHRLDPTTDILEPTLVLMTNAKNVKITVAARDSSKSTVTTHKIEINTPTPLDVLGLTEGTKFTIETPAVTPEKAATLYLSGFLSGQIRSGTYNMDIKYLLEQQGYQPRLQGMVDITYANNTIRCWAIRPDLNNKKISLTFKMPYSFASIASDDSQQCDNGPFVTTADSASFLNSDPCHTGKSGPGTYSTECLIPLFLGLGGSSKGEGYPKDPEVAQQILFDKDRARTLPDIADFLRDMGLRASTGLSQGVSLSLEEWDAASRFMTGESIANPCQVDPNQANGPLRDDCIQFLYTDPATYNPLNVAEYESNTADGSVQFCNEKGRLNPYKPEALAAAKAIGGTEAVINLYKTAHNIANDNSLDNIKRRDAMLDCYGIPLQHQRPEVFLVTTSSGYTKDQAESTCRNFGPDYAVATTAQLKMANGAGADWGGICGFVSDNEMPMTQTGKACNVSDGGVLCYGSKPFRSDIPSSMTVAPFNGSSWANPASD